MIEHLNRTKEVWMYDFLCLWRKGGMASYAQYSNGDKFDYLYVAKAGGKELSHDTTAIHNIARVYPWTVLRSIIWLSDLTARLL